MVVLQINFGSSLVITVTTAEMWSEQTSVNSS